MNKSINYHIENRLRCATAIIALFIILLTACILIWGVSSNKQVTAESEAERIMKLYSSIYTDGAGCLFTVNDGCITGTWKPGWGGVIIIRTNGQISLISTNIVD